MHQKEDAEEGQQIGLLQVGKRHPESRCDDCQSPQFRPHHSRREGTSLVGTVAPEHDQPGYGIAE